MLYDLSKIKEELNLLPEYETQIYLQGKEKGIDPIEPVKGRAWEEIDKEESLWDGECFVFDQRVAVTHGLKEGQYDQCYACRHTLSPNEMDSKYYKKGISCPYCYEKLTNKKKASVIERQKQIELAKLRGENHIGKQIREK